MKKPQSVDKLSARQKQKSSRRPREKIRIKAVQRLRNLREK